MFTFPPGSTGISIQFFLRDSTAGEPKTGLTPSSGGANASYTRQNGTASSISLVSLASATAAWQAGGWFEIDPVKSPGLYRLDLPDAALAAGVSFLTVNVDFTGVLGEAALILLQAPNNLSGAGALTWTINATNANTSAPLGGVSCWATTDQGGNNVVAGSLTTSTAGTVSFYLNSGTYYLWVSAAGYSAANPTAFTVGSTAGSTAISLTPSTAPIPNTPAAGHVPRHTCQDTIDRLLDHLGSNANENGIRQARRALLDAYKEITQSHTWTYLTTFGRIQLNGPFNLGSVYYQYSDGSYPRQLTLVPDPALGGVWPSWANLGYVRINNIVGEVDQRISDTVLTLLDPVDYAADLNATTLSLDANNGTLTYGEGLGYNYGEGLGNGTIPFTVTAQTSGNTVLPNITVLITTDPQGQNVIAGPLITNSAGQIGFTLLPGSYYLFANGSGYALQGTPLTISVGNIPDSQILTMVAGEPSATPPVGIGYVLYQDSYTLPADFVQGDNTLAEQIWGTMTYIPPAQWLAWVRYRQSYGVPRFYTVMGDPKNPGRLSVKIYPYPQRNSTLDFIYHRAPRPLSTMSYTTGTASLNPGTSQVTVTFSGGTILTQAMVGSILRLSADSKNLPTGTEGLYPAAWEGTITSVSSPTTCTIDNACPTSFANVVFRISDPIDIEDQAMLLAYYRCCEKNLGINRTLKEQQALAQAYQFALEMAKECDARIQARRSAGVGGHYRPRLAFMPRGSDIS